MLSDPDAAALCEARHADPFSVLGMHADAQGQWWVRALLPGAAQVHVHDTLSGRAVATLQERSPHSGLFEAPIPRRRRAFDYRLRVQWSSGDQGLWGDPYRYGPLISDLDLHLLSEGTHERPYQVLGAHALALGEGPYRIEGVRFAVWAPNASRVSVVGPFNAWDGRRHPMRSRGASGVWELFVPHVVPGDLYKFEIRTREGRVLPLKSDPYARQAQLRPDTASLVAAPLAAPRPLPPDRAAANHRQAPISIYEVHAGSWKRHPDGRFYTWDELAQSLPAHAADLGFTHLELMPVSEHPFDGSWGYQTLGMYAPTARFGPPEAFVRFVQACHDAGLGLLVDWVPAHFPYDAHGLAQFDGTALYEYADPKEGFHRDWNTLIYNFARREVRNFLAGSALYWVEQLGVDGLRVDAVASMLYRDYSREAGQWIPNVHGGRENLEAISLLQRVNEAVGRCPGALTVAEESTAFAQVSAPTYAGGLGFHFKWNMGWMNDTLRYMSQDPIHRRWHHEQMTFGLVYAFSENFVLPLSHDEVVHGKGSILGRMPGDEWQRFANLRAYYGFMWGHPGKKLLFMGQEFAQGTEWSHDSELPWWLLQYESHQGVMRLVRDLNRVYREHSALHQLDCSTQGFEWIDAHDASSSVFSWVRRDAQGAQVLVVSHMTPLTRVGYRLGVPEGPRAWRVILNTDAACYGGSNFSTGDDPCPTQAAPAHGRAQSIELNLPPLATLYLVPA